MKSAGALVLDPATDKPWEVPSLFFPPLSFLIPDY